MTVYGFHDKAIAEFLRGQAARRVISSNKTAGVYPSGNQPPRYVRSYLATPKTTVSPVKNQTVDSEFKKIPGQGTAYILKVNDESECGEMILSKDLGDNLGEITVYNLNPISYHPTVSSNGDITEYTKMFRVVEDMWGRAWIDDAILMRIRGRLLTALGEADEFDLPDAALPNATLAVYNKFNGRLRDSGRRVIIYNRLTSAGAARFSYQTATWEEDIYEWDGGDCDATSSSGREGSSTITPCIPTSGV